MGSLEISANASRMQAQRAQERDLKIPRVVDPIRRKACLDDTYEFLRVYFGWIFYQPFTTDRREMVDAIEHAARYGGDQAVAGPRADGKTRSALFVALKLQLAQAVRFPVIVSKNGPRAHLELKNLKDALRDSELLLADFPEVVYPIVRLGRWASRARQQTAYGVFTNLEWSEECIVLPTISTDLLQRNGWNQDVESAACGQIAASLGIEGPIRGYTVKNERPDLAIIDDIDDRESARSDLQTQTRASIIEQDIGGLAGPDKTIARVMLCTLINRTCVAAIYTDRQQKPSWRGQRHKLLHKLPDRADLWDEYIALRQGRSPELDPDARKAHEFYLANRELMDAGAEVTNPYRFDARPLKDGEPGQVSALQACYDLIADRNWDHFNTEYQNDPPPEEGHQQLVLSAHHIQNNCLSGLDRRIVPEGTEAVTIGADVQKLGLHYVAMAWDAKGAGSVIEYDFYEFQTQGKKAADCELLILEGLFAWHEMLNGNPFMAPDGEEVFADLALIDTGWKEETWNNQPVQQFCAQVGFRAFLPSKGIANYHRPADSRRIIIGDNWHLAHPGGIPVLEMNADHWKLKVHEGFLASPGEPGSITLFDPPRIEGRVSRNAHISYSKHIVSETWETRFVPGFRGSRTGWWKSPKPNHYLDATYQAIVARSVRGISVLPQHKPKERIEVPAEEESTGRHRFRPRFRGEREL